TALFRSFGSRMLLIKTPDALETFFDHLDSQAKIIDLEGLSPARPGQNQKQLRLELAQCPDQLLRVSMFFDEIEHIQVAFGITDHPCIILQLKQTNISMVILESLELKFGTVL